MNKKELIRRTARKSNVSIDKAGKVINDFIGVLKNTVSGGEAVTIRELGRFYLKEYPGRTVKSPNGLEYEITPRKVPGFKAGAGFKRESNPKRS